MKTVTLKQFLTFGPCWLNTESGRERLERIAARKKEWTALDVLRLPDKKVSPKDKLWAVLREEFIDARTLHEFACICAERALTLAGVTDERCWNAIKAKRAWLRGEISDDELDAKTALLDARYKMADGGFNSCRAEKGRVSIELTFAHGKVTNVAAFLSTTNIF